MQKILFDLNVCQPINHIKYHGGGVYGYKVFYCLAKACPNNIIAYYNTKNFLDPVISQLIQDKNIKIIDASEIPLDKSISNEISFVYSPLYNSYLNNISIPVFCTIHGLRKLEMNRDHYEYLYAHGLKGILKSVVKQSPLFNYFTNRSKNEYSSFLQKHNVHIITVSYHSKNSIRYYYPNIANSIEVFYSPSTEIEEWMDTSDYNSDPYYLIISADRWLKNSFRALKAFDNLISKKSFHKKIIVVGLDRHDRIISKLNNKNSFIFLEYQDRQVLESLYKSAYCLVYPSLNEGFGYPPLEAMKYGTPVISSGVSSLPEVLADSVIYSNPYSIDEIGMRILQMEDKTVHDKYVLKSLDRYKYIHSQQESDLTKLVNLLLSNLL